jgi:hypothetical protein
MVREGEKGNFHKLEWMEKCEMDWSLANGMGQDRWTCFLGLHIMSGQKPQITCFNGLLPCLLDQDEG